MENFIYIQMKMQKILKSIIVKDLKNQNWKSFIPAKDEVLIGGLVFLNNWIIRSETSKCFR